MKTRLTVILFLALCASVSAQKPTVKWSKEFLEEKGEHLGSLIHYDGKYSYFNVGLMRNTRSPFTALFASDIGKITPGIMKFDDELKPVKREDYKISSDEDQDILYNGIYYLDRSFVMLQSTYDKRSNTRELFGQKINYETLKAEGKPVSIMKVSGEKNEALSFGIAVSEDTTKLVIVVNPEQKKKKKEKFAFKIIDKNFKTISEKSVELPYNDEDFNVISTKVNNKNQMYLLAKAYENGSKKESVKDESGNKVAAYEIILKRYSPDGNVKDYKLDIGGKFLSDFELTLNSKGDLFLVGLFKEEDNEFVSGYFYFHLDGETGKVLQTNKYEFTLPFITKVNEAEDDKTKKNTPGISSNFVISDLIVTLDGRIFLILEKDWWYIYKGKSISYPVYLSCGIIAMQLDAAGKANWQNYIPKMQFYNDITAYLYYSYMVLNDRIMLFFNDRKENIAHDASSGKQPKKFNDMKEMTLMSVTIDDKGKASRKVFSDSEKMGTLPYISLSQQLSPKKYLLYGFKYKKKTFGYDVNAGTNKLGILTFE